MAIKNMASQSDVENVIAVYSETGIFVVTNNHEKEIEDLLSNPKIQVHACGVAMKMNNFTEKRFSQRSKSRPNKLSQGGIKKAIILNVIIC